MPKIAILGTGLIGTSIALGLKQARVQNLELLGADLEREARHRAQKRKAFNSVGVSLPSAARDADIVVISTPVMAMREVLETIAPHLQEGCIVTDVGSSKRVVLEWAEELLPRGVDFVGGHPMAGKESSGPEAADGGLFRGKAYCVIPGAGASNQAVSEVTALAEALGATPLFHRGGRARQLCCGGKPSAIHAVCSPGGLHVQERQLGRHRPTGLQRL